MNNNGDKQLTGAMQESRNIAILLWIGTFFFGFIPAAILYFLKSDDSYVFDQSKEALNWVITVIIFNAAAWFLSFIFIGIFLFPIIGLCHTIFCILGVIATFKGNIYRVPFAIRLIK